MSSLIVLNGPEVGQKVDLTQETFFIGRDPNNHLVLSDRTVSRKHAVINRVEGKTILSDLKSLKGLLVNGVKKEEAVLEDGDEIALGAVRLRFYGEGPKKGIPFPFPSRRKRWGVFITTVALLLILVGAFYLWKGRGFLPVGRNHSNLLKEHYEKGIQLFNASKDTERAKSEWLKVLELDSKKETPYGQNAAKLLQNLQ